VLPGARLPCSRAPLPAFTPVPIPAPAPAPDLAADLAPALEDRATARPGAAAAEGLYGPGAPRARTVGVPLYDCLTPSVGWVYRQRPQKRLPQGPPCPWGWKSAVGWPGVHPL